MVTNAERHRFIQQIPCFARFTPEQVEELSILFKEVSFQPNETIVHENDLVDSIFIIVNGSLEVTQLSKNDKKNTQVPLALLGSGDSIGLHDSGFYATQGKRTATVKALTPALLLRLELDDLTAYLHKYHLESNMYAASKEMLTMRFIKQSLAFSKLAPERLQWLASKVRSVSSPKGTVIFNQGEVGDQCYLIQSGVVDIVAKDQAGNERVLAQLKSPALFGEATLITRSPRNAMARVAEDAELFVLSHADLSELLESENAVATMFMSLMVDRSRPIKNPRVSLHERKTVEGETITILKNADSGSYFKLSKEGAFVWEQLNGHNTMQDITLDLAEKYKIFVPDVVAALISKLTRAGFISNIELYDELANEKKPLWVRAFIKVRHILESRIAFGDSDKWVTKSYNAFVHYFFTSAGQVCLAILAIAGIIGFAYNTPNVLLFFSFKNVSLLLVLGLIPLSLIEVVLHELGHAYAVKAYGREVHYIGVGWYWFAPIAFTDTSDMWLSARKPRMMVNFAGIYVDILIAGIAALLTCLIENPYVQSMLWLFAIYTYVGAFRMLSPLQEMDGYYILSDWLEKPHLRHSAVVWLVNVFPKSLRHPKLLLNYRPEVIYWLACLLYLVIISAMTLVLQFWVFSILGIQSSNPYLSLILPFIVVIFSSLSIIADIKNQAEE